MTMRPAHHPFLLIAAFIFSIASSDILAASPIKVMSFNIRFGTARDGDNRWDVRKDSVVEVIRHHQPDLIGLQEVLKFQADYLLDHLPDYAFHGAGRDDGKEGGEYSPVMYRQKRFERTDGGHFWLSPNPEVPGSRGWDADLPRMVSWVALKDQERPEAPLIFGNTHFDHRGQTARWESARLVRQKIEQAAKAGLPVILTGDFNASEGSDPYKALVAPDTAPAITILDTHRVVHPTPSTEEGTFNGWKPKADGRRIDWILCTQDWIPATSSILNGNYLNRIPSDHYPILTELKRR